MTNLASPELKTFEQDSRRSVDDFIVALNELFSQVGIDPADNGEGMARLGVNKTLAWKLSKMTASTDIGEVLSMLPGSGGLQILARAFEDAGATKEAVRRLKDAAARIRNTVEHHVSDRATLELVLDGMSRRGEDRLETSRKLMFRGASGILGVQAKARIAAGFIAPNAEDPNWLDLAVLAGFHDFRRLRPDVRWPLYRLKDQRSPGDPVIRREPVKGSSDIGLLDHVGSSPRPEITRNETPQGTDYVLEPGPLGNTGAFNALFGHMLRRTVCAHARVDDTTHEFAAFITTPVETFIADVFVHEDAAYALDLESMVLGSAIGLGRGAAIHTVEEELARLPIETKLVNLPGSPPSAVIPRVPEYAAAVSSVFETIGYPRESFRAKRLTLSHPPIGSAVVLRFNLPDPPGGG